MTIYKKNGKYYSRFKIHGEQRHFLCQGAKSVSEAQAIEDAEKFKLRQEQAGLIKKKSRKTVHQMLDEFLRYSKMNKKSYVTDVCRVRVLKTIISSGEMIADVLPRDIEVIKGKLLGRGLGETTVNKYLALLSKSFGIEVENNEIEQNPCKKVKYFKKKNNKIRYLLKEEEERLFKVFTGYMGDIIHTALYTGLRKENILSLRWEQIDFRLGNIEVLENKGNKHIIIPIVEPLRDILERLRDEGYSNEYVFANPKTGTRYYEIDRCWRDGIKKAGIKDFRFHDLRHTVGTRLAEAGVSINVIKEILAHSDIRTTMRYVHLVEGSKKSALESIL